MKDMSVDMTSFDLSNLSTSELAILWRQNLRDKVPEHLPKSLVARLLAYQLQVAQHSGLSKKAVAYLKPIEADLRDGKHPEMPYLEEQKLKFGCQLVREYDGTHYRVTVVDGGYEWNGTIYASLSSVAKAITGTNWNGHRFFGLKAKARALAEHAL